MKKKFYEIDTRGAREIPLGDFTTDKLNKSSVYVCDLIYKSRTEAAEELRLQDIPEGICDLLLNPADHIRFETYKDITYGEIAYFASKSKSPLKYMGVVNTGNILYLIYEEGEDIIPQITDSINEMTFHSTKKIEVTQVLYILLQEILTSHGKLILTYREEIESLAKDFDKNVNEVEPDEFLESKSHLSDFSQVLEKLQFSLSFPPVKSIIGLESPYKQYFQDLLKTIEMLKISLAQAENRLNSLHDHYLLLLQEKSNKRINFLTIIQAIFVPLTLLAGIYGMNFSYMPELNYKYAYFISLGAMLVIALVFLRYFYKRGWFD